MPPEAVPSRVMADGALPLETRPGEGARPARLLVSIPALDEAPTVADVVRGVPAAIAGVGSIEIVVVDDGSRDDTAARARAAGARVIRHERPLGAGAAFHSALAYGIDRGADLIATLDGDGQFDPASIPALVEPVLSGRAEFATASRFLDPELTPAMPWIRRAGNRWMSRLISRLAGQRLTDVSCGMRCYSRHAALRLHPLARFTYTQEVILNLAFQQLPIVEVPIRVRGERAHGTSRVAASLPRYALRTLRIAFRAYRDHHPLRFFGGMALACLAPATVLAAFLLAHWLATGQLSPHKWAGFAAAALAAAAVAALHAGMVGDMLNRHRIYLEEILYRQRSGAGRDERE
jgi:glycosyltransferase involved in cell wall biosynthesis